MIIILNCELRFANGGFDFEVAGAIAFGVAVHPDVAHQGAGADAKAERAGDFMAFLTSYLTGSAIGIFGDGWEGDGLVAGAAAAGRQSG